jgi:hypothetical protein
MSVEVAGRLAALAKKAELAIQKIVLELDEELIVYGVRVETVNVDTRNFANMATDIVIEERRH